MKTVKKGSMKIAVAVTAMLMFQGMVALAQDVNLRLYKPGTEIAMLSIDSLVKGEPVSVTLRDEDGVILYKDECKASNYVKLMDFSKINNGKYFVDISHPMMVLRKVVQKEDAGLSIGKDNLYLFNNIVNLQEDNKKLLVKFNQNLDAPVTVRITDSQGHVLHEEVHTESNNYAALFNLSKLNSGVYNMSLSSANFSNSRSFQVD